MSARFHRFGRALGASVAAMATMVGASCVGTTGSDLVTFSTYVSGPADASRSLEIDNAHGWHVRFTKAIVHVGAVYLNRSIPISGAQETGCILPGIYAAEAVPPIGAAGLDVDVLSATPQPFPGLGRGTADPAVAAEVWLTSGPVDADFDPVPVLRVAGVAAKQGQTRSFSVSFSIGDNWKLPPLNVAQPGSNPICKQRIASPLRLDGPLVPRNGGALYVTIDPRPLFENVDFGALSSTSSDPNAVAFPDAIDDPQSHTVFLALHSFRGVYSFAWR